MAAWAKAPVQLKTLETIGNQGYDARLTTIDTPLIEKAVQNQNRYLSPSDLLRRTGKIATYADRMDSQT
jgi:hypothetical protein